MRQFLSVLFLASLYAAITLVSGVGSAFTSAGSIFNQYWKRCATRHDNKYALTDEEAGIEEVPEVSGPNPKWTN